MGLNMNMDLVVMESGTSGGYLLQNTKQEIVGIFKPFDEEPFAPNNPKGYKGELHQTGFRKGILSGECAEREVAAYLLDQTHYHQVPPTTFVELTHKTF